MKMLLAGMHTTKNQFVRGIHSFGCQLVHYNGNEKSAMPTNCDAVVIAKCQISHAAFWEAKEKYLGMEKPIFIANFGFSEIASPMQDWLKKVGHLDDLGRVKFTKPEPKPVNTVMAEAFKQAEKQIEEVPVPTGPHVNATFAERQKDLDTFIKAIHPTGATWAEIADALNAKGFTTPTGRNWTGLALPGYALKHKLVPRRATTTRGYAGHFDGERPANAQAPVPPVTPIKRGPYKKAKVTTKNEGITDMEMDEIWTSNLNATLKRKVTRILAIHGEM